MPLGILLAHLVQFAAKRLHVVKGFAEVVGEKFNRRVFEVSLGKLGVPGPCGLIWPVAAGFSPIRLPQFLPQLKPLLRVGAQRPPLKPRPLDDGLVGRKPLLLQRPGNHRVLERLGRARW